jgi:hypothetical protein
VFGLDAGISCFRRTQQSTIRRLDVLGKVNACVEGRMDEAKESKNAVITRGVDVLRRSEDCIVIVIHCRERDQYSVVFSNLCCVALFLMSACVLLFTVHVRVC